jgi:hypothetical protein
LNYSTTTSLWQWYLIKRTIQQPSNILAQVNASGNYENYNCN